MKQKIVIKVTGNGPKSRTKALRIAVGLSGVESARLGGEDKSQIEVVGDGVDAVQLTNLLRKKVGYAELASVEAVGEKKERRASSAAGCLARVWWRHASDLYLSDSPPSGPFLLHHVITKQASQKQGERDILKPSQFIYLVEHVEPLPFHV
ncbi:hypothetical protein BDE02_09G040600 [Populus trichocarpa]|nr:hypothetical protein BDE02_09G040600 [Populus trichocarpa]